MVFSAIFGSQAASWRQIPEVQSVLSPTSSHVDQMLPAKTINHSIDFTAGVNFFPRCFVCFMEATIDSFRFICFKCDRFFRFIYYKLRSFFGYATPRIFYRGAALTHASYNQYNIIRRSVFRFHQPGAVVCTFEAGQAALQFLSGHLENETQLNICILRGVARALKHYGLRIPQGFFEENRFEVAYEMLSSMINEIDQNPDLFDQILQSQGLLENWETAQREFPMMEDVVQWQDIIEIPELRDAYSSLQASLEIGQERHIYLRALQAFALSVLPASRGAAIFIREPNSFAILIKKGQAGQVEEAFFVDSHENRHVNANFYFGGYMLKWTRENGLDPLNQLAAYLKWFAPARGLELDPFSVIPVQLR